MSASTRRTPSAPERAVRVQKLLADAGVASRRGAEALIRSGRVSVNGRPVTRLGTRADPLLDRVCVDGRPVGRPARRRHYLVYKPRGVVTTTRDPHARRTVLDLVPARERLFPVGRLDAASEGLLLLTNDGALAQVLLHPSFAVPRLYRVSVAGSIRAATVRRLERGVELDGRRATPQSVRLLEREATRSVIEMELVEGRRHQIRSMLRAVGHPVRRLTRVRFGPLHLGGLKPGEWRRLRAEERKALGSLVSEPPTGSKRRKRAIQKR